MKLKNVLILLVIAIILSFTIFLTKKKTNSTISNNESMISFFPKLKIDEIARIIITDGKKSVNLKKKGTNWVVEEKLGYYIDFSKLQKLVVQIASLNSSQKATKDKAHFQRLKVELPTEKNYGGILVSFKKENGEPLAQLILGEKRKSSDESNPYSPAKGQYVRIADSDQVYIISDDIEGDVDPERWMKKEIINIDKEDVKKVNIEGKDPKENIVAYRDKKGDPLRLNNILQDEKVKESEVQRISEVLSPFNIADIIPADNNLVKEVGFDQKISVILFNGLHYTLSLGNRDEKYYVKLSTEYIKPEVINKSEQKDAPSSTPQKEQKTQEKTSDIQSLKSPEELKELASTLTEESKPWVYMIDRSKFDQLTKKRSAIIEGAKKK